jgi:NAD(P)-dependent dehydrogenase (short-subunit alcohol dehydrogenase family)
MIAVADSGIGPHGEPRRAVVVTGGTDGIGAAVTRALVARGDHVVALGTNRAKAEGLRRDVAGMPAASISYRPI